MTKRQKTEVKNNCRFCNTEFILKRKDQVYCSRKCKTTHWDRLHPRIDMTKDRTPIIQDILKELI